LNYRDYTSAISLYQQCLSINSRAPGTLAALGFAFHQTGKIKEALEYYHKAHFLNNEDAMVEKLVQKALEDINEMPIQQNYLGPM
jgi:tetratricopeptide (TPR) repeat protein